MIPIVFSYYLPLYKETDIVNQLFENGLELFHLRKHNYTTEQFETYLCKIKSEYHKNIILHSNIELLEKYNLKGIHFSTLIPGQLTEKIQPQWFKSTFCFHLNDLFSLDKNFDQIIIGPIFKSISNPMYYNKRYNHNRLQNFFEENEFQSKIVAIGGIDELSANIAINLGFNGIVALGSIWTTYLETIDIKKTVRKFLLIKETCLQIAN